jgi:hypothetical protein
MCWRRSCKQHDYKRSVVSKTMGGNLIEKHKRPRKDCLLQQLRTVIIHLVAAEGHKDDDVLPLGIPCYGCLFVTYYLLL